MTPRVLIIEDDATCGMAIAAALGTGFTVDRVESIQHAITMLCHYLYQLVLLDLALPNGKGFETWQKVRPHTKSAAVVVVTGDPTLCQRCLEAGADGFIEKGAPDIVDRIREASVTATLSRMGEVQGYVEELHQVLDGDE